MPGNHHSGRRPKPSAVRILEGNRGHRPLNDHEPQPRALPPDCPEWLNEFARAEWARVGAEMCEVPGWLTVVDRAVLAAYCQSYGRWQLAEMAIDKNGSVYEAVFVDSSGQEHLTPKPRPEVKIAKDEKMAMKAFAVELGLSPTARGKLSVGPRADGGDDDLD